MYLQYVNQSNSLLCVVCTVYTAVHWRGQRCTPPFRCMGMRNECVSVYTVYHILSGYDVCAETSIMSTHPFSRPIFFRWLLLLLLSTSLSLSSSRSLWWFSSDRFNWWDIDFSHSTTQTFCCQINFINRFASTIISLDGVCVGVIVVVVTNQIIHFVCQEDIHHTQTFCRNSIISLFSFFFRFTIRRIYSFYFGIIRSFFFWKLSLCVDAKAFHFHIFWNFLRNNTVHAQAQTPKSNFFRIIFDDNFCKHKTKWKKTEHN